MLRNNADARRCSYFELGLPVVALNNLFSADFETASIGKRKYKPGEKL